MSPKNASRDKRAILRLIYKIIALILIPIIVFSTISHIDSLSGRQIADLLEIFNFSKFGTPLNSALTVFLLLLFGLFAFFPLIRLIQKFFSALTGKYFVISLAALAVLGATASLYIPSYTNWFKPDIQQSTGSTQPTQNGQGSGNQQNQSSKDPSSDLRLHLLYITGGIIAVLGLIETNRKNSQDHIRQVHAARRDRYIEAVDKLSSEQAPVRLGGVYALVGLVDEWLDDDNIDKETRIKEGQIIINNLCSYIRSPFPLAKKIEELKKKESKSLTSSDSLHIMILNKGLAETNLNKSFTKTNDEKKIKQITAEYAKIQEEQDVRRTIFVEISKRSSTFAKDKIGKVNDTFPGMWSDFDFDFSRAPIFYPLNAITIEKGIFSSAKFYSEASFHETTFIQDANFSRATFTQDADFIGATFAQDADFSEAIFTQDAFFMLATFTQEADFSEAIFTQYALFISATFTQDTFFQSATFTQDASFQSATFTKKANFRGATFMQKTDFSYATFENYEPLFANGEERAKFSIRPSHEDYIFSVASGSKSINRKPATLLGKTFEIPLGTVLFDPDSPKDQLGNYAVQSDPAK